MEAITCWPRMPLAGVIVATLAVLIASSLVVAQQPVYPGYLRGAPVNLFDGHSLNGWNRRDGSPHPGWDVDDGALHRKAGGGDLYYKEPVGDFELYFQWRIAEGGNSGLKYRVRDYEGSWLGCEYQLLDDAKHRDANKTAGLYDVFDPFDNKPVVFPGIWNYSCVVVCGNRIEHWLNGVMTVQANVGSSTWKKAVAESKFSNVPGFGENRTGLLFLQDHGDEVWFREIVLLPLNGCGLTGTTSAAGIECTNDPPDPLPGCDTFAAQSGLISNCEGQGALFNRPLPVWCLGVERTFRFPARPVDRLMWRRN